MPVVDTSYLVAVQRRDEKALAMARLLEDAGAPLLLPAVVWLEYLVGFTGRARSARQRQLRNLFRFEALDEEIASVALRLQDQLRKRGEPMAWADLTVAATALRHAEPLLTVDGDFARVSDLEVIYP